MIFSNTYFHKVIKYDIINTFKYQNLDQLPELNKIVLNFGYSKSNLKYLISGLLALEFVSSKKGKLTKAKNLNLLLKIKKGNPTGCKVILRKNYMYLFYFKLITSSFSKIKHSQLPQFPHYLETFKSLSYQLKSPLFFAELESQFQFFRHIPSLDITLCTNAQSQKELFFLLKSIKFIIANVTQFGRV
jgi:ribosomal protein L5